MSLSGKNWITSSGFLHLKKKKTETDFQDVNFLMIVLFFYEFQNAYKLMPLFINKKQKKLSNINCIEQ